MQNNIICKCLQGDLSRKAYTQMRDIRILLQNIRIDYKYATLLQGYNRSDHTTLLNHTEMHDTEREILRDGSIFFGDRRALHSSYLRLEFDPPYARGIIDYIYYYRSADVDSNSVVEYNFGEKPIVFERQELSE